MKGLDGIQGPIYVGTGCVFRRQALYGFDAPKKKKAPSRTCNCWPKWCCCSWCSSRKKKKGDKSKKENKPKFFKRTDSGAPPVFALGGTEEGAEGTLCDIINFKEVNRYCRMVCKEVIEQLLSIK